MKLVRQESNGNSSMFLKAWTEPDSSAQTKDGKKYTASARLQELFSENCNQPTTAAEIYLKFKELYNERADNGLEFVSVPNLTRFPVSPDCNPVVQEELTELSTELYNLSQEALDYLNIKPMLDKIQ